jgi:hypothetical protein
MLAAYGLRAEALSSYRAAHPRASVGDLFSAIQTVVLAFPAICLADAHATKPAPPT